MDTVRVKAVIAYDGTPFYGFQSQTTTPRTITGALSGAMKRLGIESHPTGSGRTDRGVHATGQVIHFDLPPHWQGELKKLKIMLNRQLRPHIQFKHISEATERFHARFDAKRRIYRYVFKKSPPTPFEAPYCRHLTDLHEERLLSALKLFEGRHDFTLFHKKGSDPGSCTRTLYRVSLYTFHSYTIAAFEADGYLRSQVRMMVETGIRVMKAELDEEAVRVQLAGKRVFNTPVAEPQALYLAHIIY